MGDQHRPFIPRSRNDPPGTRRPAHCGTMAEDQTTGNAYAVVAESILSGEWHDHVDYLVRNTGEDNDLTARLVGRYVSVPEESGNPDYSDWQPITLEGGFTSVVVAADTSERLQKGYGTPLYDQYAVEVKSTTTHAHTDCKVFGSSRQAAAMPAALSLSLELITLAVELEAEVEDTSDLIVANLQFSQAGVIQCKAELVDADGVAALVADAHLDVEAAGGTLLTTANKQAVLFETNADGSAALEITDVDGDLETSYWLLITPLDILCPPKAIEAEFTEPA